MSDERGAGGDVVLPDGWSRPSGYSDAVVASGRIVSISGQIGWDPVTHAFEGEDFVAQTRQALHNVVTLLLESGARPQDLVRMTWYIVNRDEYIAARKEIGALYREIIGQHYPAMSVVVVSGLVEQRARVEIEATAVIGD